MVLVQPSEGEAEVNGLRLHYFEWKGEGKRPLVLMHGLRDYAYFCQTARTAFWTSFTSSRPISAVTVKATLRRVVI